MNISAHGFSIPVPAGWDVRIRPALVSPDGAASFPAVHAADFGLPSRRSDYGSGVVDLMGAANVFVALIDFGPRAVGTALFSGQQGIPRQLDPASFHPNQMQRPTPGRSGLQVFCTEQSRAFCLYVVLGSHSSRVARIPAVNQFLAGISVNPA